MQIRKDIRTQEEVDKEERYAKIRDTWLWTVLAIVSIIYVIAELVYYAKS